MLNKNHKQMIYKYFIYEFIIEVLNINNIKRCEGLLLKIGILLLLEEML